MKDILTLLSRFLLSKLTFVAPLQEQIFGKVVVKFAAFICLITGYIIGCRAFYHRVEPYWGEALSLLAICGVLLATSAALFITIWFLKPKLSPADNLIAVMDKTLEKIPYHEALKNLSSPKTMMAIFALGAMTYYLFNFKRKSNGS